MNRLVLALFFSSIAFGSIAQDFVGTDFRFSFMKNLNTFFNTPPKFDVSIHAFEDLTATVEYGDSAEPFYQVQTITISGGQVGVVSFDNDEFLNQETLDVVETRSFRVTTDGDARVYAFHNRLFFADSSPILPTSALGSDYMIMSYEGTNGAFPSLFSIIGAEDNTTVTVIPASSTVLGTVGDPFTIELDAGQVITISSSGDLTGSRVTTNGPPVAVFGGHQQSLVGTSPGCGADSHLWEQMMPLEDWGTNYAVVPVFGNDGDLVRILAAADGTEVFVDCELLTTLDEGEYFDQFFSVPTLLSTSQPVSIAAYTVGGDCAGLNTGDPNMRIVLPLERGNSGIELRAEYDLQGGGLIGQGPAAHFVHLVMPTEDTGGITVNGNSVTSWSTFPTQTGLSYASVSIESLDNLLSISSDESFWAEVISMDSFDVFSMTLGSDSDMDIPSIGGSVVNLGPDQTICQGETLILDPGLGQSGTWQDGSFQETFIVTEAGVYSISVEDACGNGSDEVVISEGFEPNPQLPEEVFICNDEDQVLQVEPEPGVSYSWNTGDEGNSIIVNGLGTFTVTATSSDGCISEATTIVSSAGTAEVTISGPEEICEGTEITLVASADEEGTFVWENGGDGPILEIDTEGIYQVVFTPNDGCEVMAFFEVSERGLPVVFAQDTLICDGDVLQLTATVFDGEITWPGISDGPVASISAEGFYTVEATNECGSSNFTVSIETKDCSCPAYVPNAFTPNGDGLNDLFIPEILCDPEFYELVIFNRWGKEVFSSNDPEEHWNGNSRDGDDFFSSDGVYNYILKFDNPIRPLNQPQEYTGTVTLIR